MSDTATATVEVLDITMLPGRGRLQGLALVEVTLDGVAIILQGAGAAPGGWAELRGATVLPAYRRRPSAGCVLPIELEEAVARAVLERAGAAAVVVKTIATASRRCLS